MTTTYDSDPADVLDVLPAPVRPLLDAIMSVSGELDLPGVLTRIVEAATALTDARYGALGVLGADGGLAEFVTTGIDETTRARIGPEPRGHGILGLLISDARALRLDDLRTHPASVGLPAQHPLMRSFLGVPIRVGSTVFGNLYLTEKARGEQFTAYDETLVRALANVAGLAIANARAYGLSERRRQWLEASAELADALQPPIGSSGALDEIVCRARAISRASAALIVQFPVDASPLVAAADSVDHVDLKPLVRHILREVRIADESSVALDVDLGGALARVIPLRSHLADPGALVVVLDGGASFGDDDRDLLLAWTDQACLALDRAQAVAERQELAVVSERARIARDLHDVVIQRLFATGLKLQGLRAAADDELVGPIDDVVDDLDLTIQDIRTTIFGLEQQALGSLRGDIRRAVDDYAGVLGVAPALHLHGPVELVNEEAGEHVLEVLHQGLANVARHPLVSEVVVDVAVTESLVRVQVVDTAGEDERESVGPSSTERAELLGGTLEVIPHSGPGSTFRWICPLPPAA